MAHAPARTVSTAVVPSRSRGTRSVVSPAVWRAGSVKSFRAGRVHGEVRQPTLFDGSASRGRDGGWAPRPRGEPMIDPKCEPQGGGGLGEASPRRAYDSRREGRMERERGRRPLFELDEAPQAAKIKVIGLGGGGSNAGSRMMAAEFTGGEFIVANTDVQALYASPAPVKLQIAAKLTQGRGAGANPRIGRTAAQGGPG